VAGDRRPSYTSTRCRSRSYIAQFACGVNGWTRGPTEKPNSLGSVGRKLVIGGQLRTELSQALAFVRARGLHLYGDDQWYALLPPPALEQLRAHWDPSGYQYKELSSTALPDGFQESDLFRSATPPRVIGLKGYNFPKRQLVRLLSDGHQERIIRGAITAFESSRDRGLLRVTSASVRAHPNGEEVKIAARVVIIAAGIGTKRLVRSIVGDSCRQLDRVTHTRMHMLCIKSPLGVLPRTSVLSVPQGLISVAHVNRDQDVVGHRDGDEVTWYVTPAEPGVEHREDAPDTARADIQPATVAQCLDALLTLYPALKRDAEPSDSAIRFGVFAGYKQNIGDQPIVPACDFVEGTGNVVMALPSVMLNAWRNAETVLTLLADRVKPSGRATHVPAGGKAVSVGTVNESTDEVTWLRWREFHQTYDPSLTAGAMSARGR
jgi:hypothetical protein